MQNYKVEVKNHNEGMEAQDLFLELGFKKSILLEVGYPKYVVAEKSLLTGEYESCGGDLSFIGFSCKKITIQELRAIVKPKQKEYIVKTDTGYKLQVLSDVVDGHDGIIEVPEGAEFLTECKEGSELFKLWWKGTKKICIGYDDDWFDMKHKDIDDYLDETHGAKIIWKRNESLNDIAASAEEYRQSFGRHKRDAFESISGFSEGGFVGKQNNITLVELMNRGFIEFTQPEELPFVDDTQATLNERQSQYGDFKDVASMTQELLAVLDQYGYSDMPDMHKEAIHMICSKMARIVNGDNNHVDSWHDIGGYAKLIENNIN